MVSTRLDCKLRLEVVTYALVGVVVAINVEDGQNKDIHLVEQAGHLRVTAIGGQSLRKIGGIIMCCNRRMPLCKCLMPNQVSSLPP